MPLPKNIFHMNWIKFSVIFLCVSLYTNSIVKSRIPIYTVDSVLQYNNSYKELFKECKNWDPKKTYNIFLESYEAASLLYKDEDLLQSIFVVEWDPQKAQYRGSKNNNFKDLIKKILTGNVATYVPPNISRLKDKLRGILAISFKHNGHLIITSAKTTNPNLTIAIIEALHAATNKLVISKCLGSLQSQKEWISTQLSSERSPYNLELLSNSLLATNFEEMMLYDEQVKFFDYVRSPRITSFGYLVSAATHYFFGFMISIYITLSLYLIRIFFQY